MTRTRSLPQPIRVGRRWVDAASGRSIPVVSGADDDDTEQPPVEVEIPEDLTNRDEISDEALLGMEAALVEEFDRLVDSGSKNLTLMETLAGEVERVRSEQQRRSSEDEATADAIAALAAKVKPAEATGDPEDGGDEEGGDDDAEPEAEAEAEVETKEPVPAAAEKPVTASAQTPRQRVKVPPASQVRRHAPATPDAPSNPEGLVTITAAAEVPGFTTGGAVQKAELPQVMHARAKNLSDRSARVPVAKVTRPVPYVDGQDPTEVLDTLVASLTQRPGAATPAASLVAAGGWCAPSQTYLDLFAIEGADSLFDLPTIGVTGAGLHVPSFIGYNAADQALWTWTAAMDENVSLSATDIDVATGTATITTSAAHNLKVGTTFTLSNASNAALNGTYTVATVVDTDTITATGFTSGDLTNATADLGVEKGCMRIPCPTWTEYELEAEGLCITHGNLTNRAWPALGQRYVNLALGAHERRMRRLAFAKVLATISGTDTITLTDEGGSASGELLGGIDLAAMAYRDQYGMSSNAVLEAVFPLWAPHVVRASLARRDRVEEINVTTAQIIGWFTDRNIRPQFIRDYQSLYTSGGGPLAWPATLEFVIYPAGGYFMGTGGEIDLGVQRDSRQNATNDFTLAWMEEFYLVGQRGPDGRRVTVATDVTAI